MNLGNLERVSLREAWRHEAGDFTPWLAEAENQLSETDHKHLGQILAYAAGVGARKVIWVAESFRPEHVAALRFLNENTTDSLSFFGVQIELWRIGNSPLAPKFEVVVKPDDWARAGREQARAAASASPTKQLQLKFWAALIERLAKNAPQIRPQKPRPQHWLNNSIGRSGFGLNITANTRDARLGVELWMPGEQAKARFARLAEQRQAIEQQLGFQLDWQELPDAKACRIATWLPDSSIEDEGRWEDYLAWLEQRLVIMDRVLRPFVKALP
jgi:hypothetical protein